MKTHLFHACMLYAMLPDKKRDSYDTLFSMMKECLSRRGLSLSAQYFMSNFELNFKNSFMSFFPNVECKGCLFHYSKAVISEVNKHGFKQDFSDVKKNSTFCGFIHASLGLPHVPLQRLNEGIRNCLPRLQLLCAPISKLNSQSLNSVRKGAELTLWSQCTTHPPTWNFSKLIEGRKSLSVS